MVEKEAIETWYSLLTNLPQKSKDIRESIAEAEKDAQNAADKLLDFWISILDASLSLLIILHEVTEESYMSLEKKPSSSFLSLMSRACTLTIAVRQLILRGLEDAARPVARSFLETLDLALATLGDDQFAKDFLGDGEDDENHSDKFWRNYISGQKIEKPIKNTLQLAGIDDSSHHILLEFRKNARKSLSSSTHSSVESAIFSYLVPSLGTRDTFVSSVFGHSSAYSPGTLSLMIRAIYLYSFPILSLLSIGEKPKIFSGNIPSEKVDSGIDILLALDKIIRDYDHLFPPELDFFDEQDVVV